MCNLYTYKMTAAETRTLKLHYQFIGTTWTEWEESQRQQNEPIEDVYPNKRAPVVVLQNGQHVVREDMLWGFPSTSRAPTGAPLPDAEEQPVAPLA
jgi:putative SOS response-associated peptidase YedK